MKIGILIYVKEDKVYDYIKEAHEQGFDNAQLLFWNLSYYTDENAELINKACKDFGFTITAVWCGWSGPVEWAYPKGYITLGLVPPAYRAQRVNEILRGADFANKIGVKDIITHIGYLPDSPFYPDNLGVVAALKHICKEIKKNDQHFLFETGEELPRRFGFVSL